VLRYPRPADQEIAGLIASSFAIGRVASIISVLESILVPLGDLASTLATIHTSALEEIFAGFVYRFYRTEHLIGLLSGIQRLLKRHGTLHDAFRAHDEDSTVSTVTQALDGFVLELYGAAAYPPKMISIPSRGSGCKRLHLFMRWMVRHDSVDPGTWSGIDPSRLLVPVDAHMLNISRRLGVTRRKSGDAKTTAEITDFYRAIAPDDPVRYDFALTRLGIHPGLDYSELSVLELRE